MSKSNSAKIVLTEQPTRKEKAWEIKVKDQGTYWVPFTCIKDYKPATLEILIETWMLKQKGIKFKV